MNDSPFASIFRKRGNAINTDCLPRFLPSTTKESNNSLWDDSVMGDDIISLAPSEDDDDVRSKNIRENDPALNNTSLLTFSASEDENTDHIPTTETSQRTNVTEGVAVPDFLKPFLGIDFMPFAAPAKPEATAVVKPPTSPPAEKLEVDEEGTLHAVNHEDSVLDTDLSHLVTQHPLKTTDKPQVLGYQENPQKICSMDCALSEKKSPRSIMDSLSFEEENEKGAPEEEDTNDPAESSVMSSGESTSDAESTCDGVSEHRLKKDHTPLTSHLERENAVERCSTEDASTACETEESSASASLQQNKSSGSTHHDSVAKDEKDSSESLLYTGGLSKTGSDKTSRQNFYLKQAIGKRITRLHAARKRRAAEKKVKEKSPPLKDLPSSSTIVPSLPAGASRSDEDAPSFSPLVRDLTSLRRQAKAIRLRAGNIEERVASLTLQAEQLESALRRTESQLKDETYMMQTAQVELDEVESKCIDALEVLEASAPLTAPNSNEGIAAKHTLNSSQYDNAPPASSSSILTSLLGYKEILAATATANFASTIWNAAAPKTPVLSEARQGVPNGKDRFSVYGQATEATRESSGLSSDSPLFCEIETPLPSRRRTRGWGSFTNIPDASNSRTSLKPATSSSAPCSPGNDSMNAPLRLNDDYTSSDPRAFSPMKLEENSSAIIAKYLRSSTTSSHSTSKRPPFKPRHSWRSTASLSTDLQRDESLGKQLVGKVSVLPQKEAFQEARVVPTRQMPSRALSEPKIATVPKGEEKKTTSLPPRIEVPYKKSRLALGPVRGIYMKMGDLHMDLEGWPRASFLLEKAFPRSNLSSKDLFLVNDRSDLDIIASQLQKRGLDLATDENKCSFSPTKETIRLLSDQECLSIEDLDSDEDWPYPSWNIVKNCNDVLAWVCHDEGDWPIVKARGVVQARATKLRDFLLDSDQVGTYESNGCKRADEHVYDSWSDGTKVAKITKSSIQLECHPSQIESSCLMVSSTLWGHAEAFIIVSRSVWQQARTGMRMENIKESVIDVKLIRPLGLGKCELTTTSQMLLPDGVPSVTFRRAASEAAIETIRNLQKVFSAEVYAENTK